MAPGTPSPGPPEPLRTERLVLRPLAVGHAEAMLPVLADPALYAFTGGSPPDRAGLERRYRSQVAGPTRAAAHGSETWLNWIAFTIEQDTAVGFVQATVTGDAADVAWLVGVAHQRQGFATEAAGAMCTWLRDAGVRRIDAHIHPDHVASRRVAVALGLADTGAIDDDGEQIWSTPC